MRYVSHGIIDNSNKKDNFLQVIDWSPAGDKASPEPRLTKMPLTILPHWIIMSWWFQQNFKSSYTAPPSATYIRRRNWSALVQIIDCCLFSVKAITWTKTGLLSIRPLGRNFSDIMKCKIRHSWKCIPKYRRRKGDIFFRRRRVKACFYLLYSYHALPIRMRLCI